MLETSIHVVHIWKCLPNMQNNTGRENFAHVTIKTMPYCVAEPSGVKEVDLIGFGALLLVALSLADLVATISGCYIRLESADYAQKLIRARFMMTMPGPLLRPSQS